jgi:hypothetical protein
MLMRMAFLKQGRMSVFACLFGLFGCGDDTGGGSSTDVCACFDPSTHAVLCEFDVTDCGTYDSSECSEEEPKPEPDPANNEAVVECAIELLLSGGEGKFGGSHSCGDGQYSGYSQVIVRKDGTLLTWGASYADLSTRILPTEHREAPTIAAIEGCANSETVSARWSCIRSEVLRTDPIVVCVPGASWDEG